MIPLDDELTKLLHRSLAQHRPDLLWVVESAEPVRVDEQLGNELRDAVGLEFAQEGLREDYEPNDLGLKLEDLIDRIARLFMDYSHTDVESEDLPAHE